MKKPTDRGKKGFSKNDLLHYISQQPGRASSFRHILDDFQADKTDRKQIKDLLSQLVREQTLVRHKGNRYEALPRLDTYRGRISLHRDGYGFVTPDENVPGITGDIFIPPPATGSALDGDYVAITIKSKRNAEGQVIRIEKRVRTSIVGQLRFDGHSYFLTPADEKLPEKILVAGDVSEHKDKLVELKLTRFTSESQWPAGEIISTIGFLDDPGVETTAIIKKYGLSVEFSEEVTREVAAQSVELTDVDLAKRTDFRDCETITIDPSTARDFDDAIDVQELPSGGFRLGIHIADVAHFVAMNSATDKEARRRGCSVYFPDRVVPMLPERLSNDICSLNPRTDRLTISVIIDLSAGGSIKKSSFHNSVICSRERMTYELVQQILDGNGPVRKRYHSLVGTVELLASVAKLLRGQRLKRGTIDFDLPEPKLEYNNDGLITGVVKAPRLFSHRIIEECMIAANEAVAQLLEREMPATVFRIHEPPDPKRVAELSDSLSMLGLRFRPKKITPAVFQNFLQTLEGRANERMISFVVLRSFRQAAYSTINQGHFGLASDAYTHFTSPIRRYPDLVVHRLLKAHIAGTRRSGYIPVELDSISAIASSRERIAELAERDLFDWKRMILLERHLGDTLDAVIISVLGPGIRIELMDYFIEGFIGVDDMSDDYYELDSRSHILIGRKTHRKYRLGQHINVCVARIDKLLGRAHFLPVLEKVKRSD